MWLLSLAFVGLVLAESVADDDSHSYEDTPQAAFEEATKSQMLMIVRTDPEGHEFDEEADALIYTTTTPKASYDDLVKETSIAWDEVDDTHQLIFSYRITEPIPAQIAISDDQSLWSAFIMASYLNIDVPVLYAQVSTLAPTPVPTTGIPTGNPTPEPTAGPTISGVTIDGLEYKPAYGFHDLVWDNTWKGDRIAISDKGVTARMYTGNGHENTRTTKCFSKGNHMWRIQLYTNDDERGTNVQWMVPGIVNEGAYFDTYNQANRSCGILAHSGSVYCASWGGIAKGAWKALPAQETIELLLNCEKGELAFRIFETKDTFITLNVPECDDDAQCIYPWIQMHHADRWNQATILGEPMESFYNVWDKELYTIEYDLVWDESWMGSRIRCEDDCKTARMHTGNGHQNTRTTMGWTEGRHMWRMKLYANDNEKLTNAEWIVAGIVTEGDYFDSYNLNGRSCGILSHSVTNYCNWWGYVARGNNNLRIPSMQTIIIMLDADKGLLYFQFQGKSQPWVAFGVPEDQKLYPWCSMHYGDSRQNACFLLDTMFEFENVNEHFKLHNTNG